MSEIGVIPSVIKVHGRRDGHPGPTIHQRLEHSPHSISFISRENTRIEHLHNIPSIIELHISTHHWPWSATTARFQTNAYFANLTTMHYDLVVCMRNDSKSGDGLNKSCWYKLDCGYLSHSYRNIKGFCGHLLKKHNYCSDTGHVVLIENFGLPLSAIGIEAAASPKPFERYQYGCWYKVALPVNGLVSSLDGPAQKSDPRPNDSSALAMEAIVSVGGRCPPLSTSHHDRSREQSAKQTPKRAADLGGPLSTLSYTNIKAGNALLATTTIGQGCNAISDNLSRNLALDDHCTLSDPVARDSHKFSNSSSCSWGLPKKNRKQRVSKLQSRNVSETKHKEANSTLATRIVDKDCRTASDRESRCPAPDARCDMSSLLAPDFSQLPSSPYPGALANEDRNIMTKIQGRRASEIDWSEWRPASADTDIKWTGQYSNANADQTSQVIEYLNKKGYTVTEQHLRREIQESGPDGRPKVKRSEDTGVHRYFAAYSEQDLDSQTMVHADRGSQACSVNGSTKTWKYIG